MLASHRTSEVGLSYNPSREHNLEKAFDNVPDVILSTLRLVYIMYVSMHSFMSGKAVLLLLQPQHQVAKLL